MRKKYLSALLFGALLFASAGTFTSCKDYDDDINNLQTQITDVKNAVAELQKLIGEGKFVTNVVAENNGLKITWNDGQSTIIENVINGEVQKGDVVTFDSETGEIKINDEATGYYVSKDPITNKFQAPYVNADGVLVLIDEEGKEVVTNIRTAPVTAVENTDGSTTLVLWVDGEKQEIIVPSAASSVTDVDIIGYASDEDKIGSKEFGEKKNGFYAATEGYVTAHIYKATKTSDWKGNKANLKGGEILAAYKMNGLVSRVAPLSVDASSLDFKLINTKNEEAPLTVSMAPYSNNSVVTGSRAASKNGMYSVSFEYQIAESNKTASDWYAEKFGSNNAPVLFALTTQSGLISSYDIAILYDNTDQAINAFYLTAPYTKIEVTNGSTKDIEVGKTYTVETNDDSFIYDAYLSFDANDIDKWGIEYDKTNAPLSFTVTKMPDNLSTKEFSFTYNYLTKKGGSAATKKISVNAKTNLDSAVQLCSEVSHRIVKKDNYFTVSLDEMFNSLGDSKKLQWIRDVNLADDAVPFVILDGNYNAAPNGGEADATIRFTEDAEGKKETTDASKAKYVKFTFANNDSHLTPETSYVATINFKPKAGAQGEYADDVINTVTVPLKITIPAFTDLLQKDMNVFDAEGKVASAYMLEAYDWVTKDVEATSTYKFNGAFKNLADMTADGFEFTLELDDNSKNEIVDGKTSAQLALLADSKYNSTATTTINVNSSNANNVAITLRNDYKAKSYGKELIVNLTGAKYCGVYEYDDTSFKIKLLSPIKEGKYVADGGAVKIASTGTTIVTAENVWATTVNDNVKYDLFKTAVKNTSDGKYYSEWARQDLAKVVFSSDGIKFVVEGDGTPSEAQVDATSGTIKTPSSISLRASGNPGDRSKLKISTTDIWGYTLTEEVDVVVE